MNYLYILSEDDNDDTFYQNCLARITEKSYEVIPQRLRKGGGISEVKRKLPLFLRQIKNTGKVENTFFIVSLDNDRSPIHPDHPKRPDLSKLTKADANKSCRFCDIEQAIELALGSCTEEWPIPGAIAIPVEMIESWQLLICNPDQYTSEQGLPIFPDKRGAAAKHYYKSSNVPDQLKDLKRREQERLKL
ncbi:MAG: hypothetical protein AAGL08_16165, partial [Cyanobacteria bacterium J06573_11]